jgi:DNA-binding NtrC family response regulator
MARAVQRRAAPRGDFVGVNVAGLDDQVFSDTLFGHARGAFTGPDRPRDGLITRAEEGTLFLDEIGDLAAVSQVKLLRLIQEGTYYPLRVDSPRQSRARLVVTTNRDVVQDVHTGTFRKDLYYRLRAHHIELPPLRASREDIALLVNHCLAKAAAALHKSVPTASVSPLRTSTTCGHCFSHGSTKHTAIRIVPPVCSCDVSEYRRRSPSMRISNVKHSSSQLHRCPVSAGLTIQVSGRQAAKPRG